MRINERDSMYGMISPVYAVALVAYAVFCATAYSFKLNLPLQIGIYGFQLLTVFVNPYLCLSGTLVSSLFAQSVLPGYLQIILFVITAVSFILNDYRMFTRFRHFSLFLIIIVEVVAFSFLGIASNMVTMMQMVLMVFLLFMMLNSPQHDMLSTVVMGYICGGFSVTLYFLFSLVRGDQVVMFRRLSFDGNIKSVATVASIALMFAVLSLLSGKPLFSNVGGVAIDIVMVVAFSVVVILTLAKGVLIGVVLGVAVYILFSPKTFRRLIRVIPIAVFSTAFIAVMMGSKMFVVQRLFEEDTNLNGRTTIWLYHFQQMEKKGLYRYLIGVGPGNIARIGELERYAHSTFLDFFFCYGLIGFVTMLYTQVRVFARIIKCRSVACAAMLVFAITMYLTHGGAFNQTLFTLEVILILLAEKEAADRMQSDDEEGDEDEAADVLEDAAPVNAAS